MERKISVPEEKKRYLSASNSSLPLCSVIPDSDTVKRVGVILKEAVKLKVRISEAEEKLEEIKNEMAALCEVYPEAAKGVRFGMCGFEYHGYVTRKALNKEKLATLVPADVIDQCYVDGTPFLSCKVIAFDVE